MRRFPLIALLFVFGCASARYNLTPTAYKQKAETFRSGNTNIIICQGKDSDLVLLGYRDRTEIHIFSNIINKTSNKNLDIIPEKIKVFGVNKNNQTTPLPLYSAPAYMTKKKKKEHQAQFSIARNSALNLMKKIRAKSGARDYAKITGNMDDSIFSADDDRKDPFAFYTYGTANEAQAVVRRELNSKLRAENQLYNNIMLKKNTIPPKSYLEAVMIINSKANYHKQYVMIFPIGTETHKIFFNPALPKN